MLNGLNSNNVFNCDELKIYFCDDASSDNSLSIIRDYKSRYSIKNLSIIETRKPPFDRKHFSHGQIEGLKFAFDNACKSDSNYFCLLDSDDVYSSSYISSVLNLIRLQNPSLILCDTQDFNVETNFDKRNIKRKIAAKPSIWPTVVLTSAIVVSYDFINKYQNAIFDFDYADVWLDSRLNILGLNEYQKVTYLNAVVFRRIHSSNDSKRMNLKRKILKQIEAAKYFNEYVYVETQFNLRGFILGVIAKYIRG